MIWEGVNVSPSFLSNIFHIIRTCNGIVHSQASIVGSHLTNRNPEILNILRWTWSMYIEIST